MPKILVVDDHSTSQRLMSFILHQKQHSVVTAMNGRQALECLSDEPFDLVITDINMPELNGIELLKHMRKNTQYCMIPVIILTGSVHDQDHIRAQEAGAIAFLTKPVGSEEILATVDQLLSVRSSNESMILGSHINNNPEQEADTLKFLKLRLKKNIHVI
jgi:CheY-like chemotaxis protein